MPNIFKTVGKAIRNVFTNRSPTNTGWTQYGGSYWRPDRRRLHYSNEKSTISAIYNQISIDCRNIDIRHVNTDTNKRYRNDVEDSGLNRCLSLSANIDQTGRAFVQDAVLSMLDEGCIAIVPVDKDLETGEIISLRVGKIVQWRPDSVRVSLYNEISGKKQEVDLKKSYVAIVENPLYAVMNEPNSTLKRLIRKLALLDNSDENDYGKLDLIIQLPYVIKSPKRKEQAEHRRKDIEMQLSGSRYGVAYTDGTEHITQLNRSLDNHLLDQIKALKEELYAQLGITQDVFNGTANEQVMLNYYNRTIEPIMTAICDEMSRKFLTEDQRNKGETLMFFRDPFKLVPINSIADIADKFTRNAILSSNELRGLIGFKPVDDPKADELSNKNLNEQEGQQNPTVTGNNKSNTNRARNWVDRSL